MSYYRVLSDSQELNLPYTLPDLKESSVSCTSSSTPPRLQGRDLALRHSHDQNVPPFCADVTVIDSDADGSAAVKRSKRRISKVIGSPIPGTITSKVAKALPTLQSYNERLANAAKASDFKEAEEIMLEIESNGLKPDAFIYTSYITACLNCDFLEKALETFDNMKEDENCSKPDMWVYMVFINFFRKKDEFTTCIQWFEEMIQSGTKLDCTAWNNYIDICLRIGDREKAIGALKNLGLRKHFSTDRSGVTLFDCHMLGHGAACLAAERFIDAKYDDKPFKIITGKGLHSKTHELFTLRTIMQEHLTTKFPQFQISVDTRNQGVLLVTPRARAHQKGERWRI